MANLTLDIDATQIVAEKKREAHYTYKGERGLTCRWSGISPNWALIVGYEFREGNTCSGCAQSRIHASLRTRNIPKDKKITAVRADSAAYQAVDFQLV